MGGQTEPEITQAPTLLPEQINMLMNLIQGVMGNVEGMPLGAPYGGPSASSFTTRPFTWGGLPSLGGGGGTPSGGEPGHPGGPGIPVGPGDLQPIEPGQMPVAAQPGAQPIGPSPSAPPTGVPAPMPMPAPISTGPVSPVNVLPEVLSTPTGSIAQDPVQQIITEILTSPFVAPFREERTGNYPRRV